MHDCLALSPAATRADLERDPAMAEPNGGLCFFLSYRKQVASAPEVMALSFDKQARWLPRLPPQLCLLLANPAQFGHRIGAGHLRARRQRGDHRDAPAWGMH